MGMIRHASLVLLLLVVTTSEGLLRSSPISHRFTSSYRSSCAFLSEEDEEAAAAAEDVPESINLATGKTNDAQWVNPDAATPPTALSWWAYPLVIYPFVLLADDLFHFLPKGGPTLTEILFGEKTMEIPIPGL